jgi:hypothetical protein
LWAHAEDYRDEFNHVRPHEALSWHRPIDVHLDIADPTEPNFQIVRTLPTLTRDRRGCHLVRHSPGGSCVPVVIASLRLRGVDGPAGDHGGGGRGAV